MVTITKYPDRYRVENGETNDYTYGKPVSVSNYRSAVFEFDYGTATSLSNFSIEIDLNTSVVTSGVTGQLWVKLYDFNPQHPSSTTETPLNSKNISTSGKVTIKYQPSISTQSSKLWLVVYLSNQSGTVKPEEATVSAEVPLSVEVSPSQLYAGNSVTLNFLSRMGRALSVDFYYNTTKLNNNPISVNADSTQVSCPESWFTTAGVSGNSMTVKVRASDGSGQTSPDASFTLMKATSSLTTVAPKSTTVDGTDTIAFSWAYSGAGTLTKSELQWSYDNATWQPLTTINGSGTTYSVPGYTFQAGQVYWRGRATNSMGLVGEYPASGTSFTVAFPTLSAGVTPSSLYTGDSITIDFTNRLGKYVTVNFYYNTTKLGSATAASDSIQVTCPESWFTTAGITGTSMTVKARAVDELGRQASDATFQLLKATGGSIVTAAPKSQTVDGTKSITFSWSYSGAGTLTKSELQWSYDNATWHTLTTIDGSGTTYSVPAYNFNAGTVYWRGRATNSFGLVGSYPASGTSFTVGFPTLSIGVTPSQLYAGNSITLDFTNRLEQTVSVNFYYNSTKLNSSSVTANSDSTTIYCPESWFTTAGVSGNSMSVKARATDTLGRTAADASFTLKRAVGGSISPSAPRTSRFDGAESIVFQWTYSGEGTLYTTYLQWSDDGETWHDLATIPDGDMIKPIDALTFPAGTIYWRAKALNSLNIEGPWCNAVSFTVTYNATSQAVPSGTPTSGTINAETNQTFMIALEASGPVYSPFLIQTAAFYWRTGYSGTYTELAMTPAADGLTASVTIEGGTFPSGIIQWYAEATDNTGNPSLTDTYTLTTLNASIEAYPTSPINTIERGTGPIVFRWDYTTLDGSDQNGAELEYSQDGTEWHSFGSVSEAATSYTAPANTLPGGLVYWHVRSKTQSDTWGPWSQAVSFQSFSAPIVQGVAATEAPFSAITWQVEGQLAYEIQVDDKRYGPYFGANVRRYVLPEPLADELHTVKVRAQNKYGLWSEWAEATVSIRNIPSPLEITLTGFEMFGANLWIQKPLYQGTFYIYRDGKLIGKTTQSLYYDIRAVGTHQYYVLDVTQSGYYTKSNTVELDCPVKEPWMCLLPEGPTLPLILSENAKRSQTITRGREVAYTQFAGAKYPEAEVGEHESLTVTGDVSFTQAQQDKAETFESFLGKEVVYKTPGGLCVAGVLEGFQRRDPKHYKSYTFSITQMKWEDYYDADSGILL